MFVVFLFYKKRWWLWCLMSLMLFVAAIDFVKCCRIICRLLLSDVSIKKYIKNNKNNSAVTCYAINAQNFSKTQNLVSTFFHYFYWKRALCTLHPLSTIHCTCNMHTACTHKNIMMQFCTSLQKFSTRAQNIQKMPSRVDSRNICCNFLLLYIILIYLY